MDYDKLTKVALKLNEASDKYNKVLIELVGKINSYNLGVEAVVNINSEYKLMYGRVEGFWGLYILDSKSSWPIASSPRQIRIKAVEFLPQLLLQLNQEANVLLNRIKEANEMLNEAVKSFEKEGVLHE